MSLRVEVFTSADWADQIAGRLAARVAAQPDLRLCLPTGRTPVPAYARLAALGPDMSRVSVFLLDEFGGLEPGHPARCDAMLRASLIDLLPDPPAVVATIDIDAGDAAGAVVAHATAIFRGGGLDLTLLGLGGNGHLGLNEPGTDRDTDSRRVELHPATVAAATGYGPKRTVPQWGVTLGLRTILASREIWLLVTGGHKAEILRDALQGPIGPAVPASFLRTHRDVTVFADEAAARLIRPVF